MDGTTSILLVTEGQEILGNILYFLDPFLYIVYIFIYCLYIFLYIVLLEAITIVE